MRAASFILGIAALARFSVASPVAEPEVKKNVIQELRCDLYQVALGLLHKDPVAIPFCSSYLSISTITATKTTTLTSSISVTLTRTVATITSTADAVTVTDTESATITTCIPTAFKHKVRDAPKRHAPPPPKPTPSCLKTKPTRDITSACSCLHIPTPRTTVISTVTKSITRTIKTRVTGTVTTTPTSVSTITVTSTVESCPTPSTTCGNQGVQWAHYYNDNYNYYYDGDPDYSNFDPTAFKSSVQPDYTATTNTIGGINNQNDDEPIYGSAQTFPLNYFALNHRGYIFAQLTGDYTFNFPEPDDIVLLWVGATAYSGWTRDNADLVNVIHSPGGPLSYTVHFDAGEYYPIRIIFGQAQGPATFSASVTAPDGTVILSSTSGPSPFLVQYSCDLVLAPPFEPFGAET